MSDLSNTASASFKDYFNRRLGAIFLLSFASGLPLILISSTLQAWFTVSGVNLVAIGAMSLVGLPYIYKPLWAPVLDRFVPIKKLGRRRSWIVLMQLLLAAALAVLAFSNPRQEVMFVASIALVIAFFSASQDIAFDAYRTDVLHVKERGPGAALNTIGYRLAMLVGGALALVLAAYIGWRNTYLIMAALMLMEVVVTLLSPQVLQDYPPKNFRQAIIEPFHEFLSRPKAWWILVFIVIYKLTDAFALSLNSTFLLRDLHFSLAQVGSISKTMNLSASIIGSAAAGFLVPYLGLYRSLFIFGFLQAASNLLFMWLAIVGKSVTLMAVVIFGEHFFGSLGTVAFVVLLMALCDHRYTATQFALLTALSAVGRVVIGPEAALVVNAVGWANFYFITFLIGIPALVLLWWLRGVVRELFA